MIPAAFALVGAAGLAGLLTRGDRRARLAVARCSPPAGRSALLGWLGVAHTLRAHAAAGRGRRSSSRSRSASSRRVALQRWPLALPFAACLAAPFRFPVHIGSQDANLLVPLYAVIGVAWLALVARRAARRASPCACRRGGSRSRCCCSSPGRPRRWPGATSATEGAKALAFYALPFGVLLAALVAHPPPLPAPRRPAARAGRAGARVRGGRRLPGAPPRRLVEPQADGLERVQLVLPRQLDLLRPVDLRPLPGRDDHAGVRGAAVRRRCGGRSLAAVAAALAWVGILTSYSQSAFVALCAAVGAGPRARLRAAARRGCSSPAPLLVGPRARWPCRRCATRASTA